MTENRQEPLLKIEGLRKDFGGLVAVADLTMVANPGEAVGLLGPNGAGKTTALRMMAGILTPTAGSVSVCGCDTQAEPLQAKRRLGFLVGNAALYRRLTPREVMRYFGRLHGMRGPAVARQTEALIRRLDMESFADRSCGALSSGQRQRASVAVTLLHDPPVLILDEPTNSLDPVSARLILDAIDAARHGGKAVLLSTHMMEEAERVCDRLVFLHQGQVRAAGALAELRRRTGLTPLRDIFLNLTAECTNQPRTDANGCVGSGKWAREDAGDPFIRS